MTKMHSSLCYTLFSNQNARELARIRCNHHRDDSFIIICMHSASDYYHPLMRHFMTNDHRIVYSYQDDCDDDTDNNFKNVSIEQNLLSARRILEHANYCKFITKIIYSFQFEQLIVKYI